jgi:hypothetical protein
MMTFQTTSASNWRFLRHAVILLPLALFASGCATPETERSSPSPTAQVPPNQIRSDCYSLLYDLLQDEKNLDKLLIVKRESPELRKQVKAIATAAASGAKQLESYAMADSTINLKAQYLPAGEIAVRKAVADTKKKVLLKPFNPRFEFHLLLTQTEALSYGWHLAEVAASHEPDPRRSSGLRTLSQTLKILYDEAVSLLAARASAIKNGT